MSELWIEFDGIKLAFAQVLTLQRLITDNPGWIWHMNDCGCCLSVHAPGEHVHEGYVVNQDGDADWVDTRSAS